MRLLPRLAAVCFVCLLLLLIQLRFLDFWHRACLDQRCWNLFDYDSELQINTTQSSQPNNSKKLPSVLIIGVKKGGTRALIDSLQLHPQIVAAKREVHYFDDDSLYANSIGWYAEQMPESTIDQIVIEKTPAYLTRHICAERVYNFNPDIKLILILRSPIIRMISDYSQIQYTRLSKNMSLLDFDKAAFKSNDETPNFSFKPISNSLYVKHISAWLAYFPLSQFIFLDGDLFIQDPLHELKRVETFLGIDHQIDKSQVVYNERKGFYCFRQRRRRVARCLGESKGRRHFNITDKSYNRLKDVFKPYNEQFFQLINRRFNWS